MSKSCSLCFSIEVDVEWLGLVVTYKSDAQLLFQAAAACSTLVAVLVTWFIAIPFLMFFPIIIIIKIINYLTITYSAL